MILAQFAFLKGTLQLELPSRVSCSFSLSSLPFCAFCRNAEGAKICLLQGLPYTVVPTPILHILLIAAKIATQKKPQKQKSSILQTIFSFYKERKKIYLLLLWTEEWKQEEFSWGGVFKGVLLVLNKAWLFWFDSLRPCMHCLLGIVYRLPALLSQAITFWITKPQLIQYYSSTTTFLSER